MLLSKADYRWEDKHAKGDFGSDYYHISQFIEEHAQGRKLSILDLGCARGLQLAAAAHEGHRVVGIDLRQTAIDRARELFKQEGLEGEFICDEFINITGKYDIVLDRGSITCCGFSYAKQVIKNVSESLTTGGRFYFSPLSMDAKEYNEDEVGKDGLIHNARDGFNLCYYSRKDLNKVIPETLKMVEKPVLTTGDGYWIVVLEKSGD